MPIVLIEIPIRLRRARAGRRRGGVGGGREGGDDGGMTSTRGERSKKNKKTGGRCRVRTRASKRTAVAFSLHFTQSCARACRI